MAYCVGCKSIIREDVTYCPHCGTKQPMGTGLTNAEMAAVPHTGAGFASVLPTNRRLWKMIVFGILTLGIYSTIINECMVQDLNTIATPYDGKRTLGPSSMGVLSVITLFVYMFVWGHTYSDRIGTELRRRGIAYSIGPVDFWIFNVLLCFTIVCPFIYQYKVIKAMNLLAADYNQKR